MSLGASLAEMGHRTLIVDLDPQADLTLAAGLAAEALTCSAADWLDPEGTPLPLEIETHVMTGLDILPTDPRLAGVERRLYDQDGYETTLAQKLAPWRERYAYVLLDCPPSLGGLSIMALTASRWVLVPVQCEYYAARRVNRLLDVIELVKERTNPDLAYYLLATLYDQRNRICQGVLGQLQTHFSERLMQTVIGVDTRLRESPAAGEPIITYAPRTRASQQYRELARELHQRLTAR